MEKHIINEKTGIGYTLQGDYYIPNLYYRPKRITAPYAIYSNVFTIVQIQCNHHDLCANATSEEKIEYKEAMEQLIELGYVESKRNMLKFIYITKKGLDFINLQDNDLQKI